ncbi:putative lipopolysaccharide heptosyltransferase III [Chromobacterium violaceum]|uniref:Lipopolysaccharide core heptosyltransferase rfaQ n=1 Tax=Chromobacterium violaceum TaxID=536 RepID=A0AAX2MHP9_CHRVL|nr:putative lipopolysaccharide heptosyltransferase III [Chromobacterium violaceum]OLZ87551.1 putative lipopolysaccharide heptosyltransferase III [Chromobacterium violaceum]STB69303.1 Lipopolysaccharide core heptosyltransferase rfaQ [Chromobacterium violaceum]SUY93434.1 Lipopolysaccharide core heptosyltransferase rfaQ [Chromobacterium violaceum]
MPQTEAPDRILLIKLRHHGDILLTTPVARTLKSRFPQCEIDMLVYRETVPLLQHNPDIARVWTLDRSLRGWRKLVSQLRLLLALRRRRYQTVIHLSDQMQGAFFAKLLARRHAIGFDYPKRRKSPWHRFFTALAPLAPSDTLHTVSQNLLALSPLGITPTADEQRCVLPIQASDREAVAALLREAGVSGRYIVIHPSSRWFFKCWEDDRFAGLAEALASDGWSIVLTAAPDPAEMDMVAAIQGKIRSDRVVSVAGRLTLNQLAAIIDGARMFIGVDSVPMHMAAALGKDTVALFGPSKIHEWHPWMTRHRLLNAADYGELIDPDQVDTSTRQRYLKNIPLEAALRASRELLSSPAQE